MFKRRQKRSYSEIASGFVFPRGGWRRSARYITYRLRRLPDPAHKIARGIACGVFVCFTPFYGLHFLMSAGMAWAIGGNVLAALLATFFGNPITFPVIAVISVEFGAWILGQPPVELPHIVSAFSFASVELWSNMANVVTGRPVGWARLYDFFQTVFWPYTVGGLVPGAVAGLGAYFISNPLIHAYQRARINRMKRKISRLGGTQERTDSAAGAE